MVKVSIIVMAYNHERFIAKALDSILMQKTQYSYEVILGEDCSTDSTREIVKSYIKRFNGRLKPVFRKKNRGMHRNMIDLLKRCRGEYIAFLEGDDYWTSDEKLEKQIGFLEANKDFIACYHNFKIIDQNENVISNGSERTKKEVFTKEMMGTWELPGQTATMITRASFIDFARKNIWKMLPFLWIPFDRSVVIEYLANGKIMCFPEYMSVYRKFVEENGSNWTSKYEKRNNGFYFYLMMLGTQLFSIVMGCPIDFLVAKSHLFIMNFRLINWDSNKMNKLRWFMQCVLMFLVEPRKIKLTKAVLTEKEKI